MSPEEQHQVDMPFHIRMIPVFGLVKTNMLTNVMCQVLQSALVTFDLMESLTVRIEEIAEEKLRVSN